MKKFICILSFLLLVSVVQAQQSPGIQKGIVSFITSSNVYVKFDNTTNIEAGDTLLYQQKEIMSPCLVVMNKSSTSCVTQLINGCTVKKGEVVFFSPASVIVEDETNETAEEDIPAVEEEFPQLTPEKEPSATPSINKEKIRGRVSMASYSSMANDSDTRHRGMMRMSFRGDHLRNSPLSLEAYLNYRQNIEVSENLTEVSDGQFRVYNLAISYDVDSSMQIVLGRKINHRASSLGAIDGLQAEKHFGGFFAGGIVGFRPDMYTYGLNTDLFEYGGYLGFESRNRSLYSSTTMGLLEQHNAGSVDRRYVYFQHHSNIGRSLYLFGSFELDLFAKINDEAKFNPRMTNLYASARYRFSRMLDLTLSYDSRKNIIYYETLKTEVERLLDDDEARQGARVRINIRPFKYFNSGISYSKRFQNDRQNKSNNINGYISHSKMPLIDGRMSLHLNWNQSMYHESRIMSFRYSRSIIKRKLEADLYYRAVQSKYLSSENKHMQQYYGASMNFNIGRSWMFSLLYELSTREAGNNHRINTRIIRRFG